jgi:hypothetical protein
MMKHMLIATMAIVLMVGACALRTTDQRLESANVKKLLPCVVRIDVDSTDQYNRVRRNHGSGTIIHREPVAGGIYFIYHVLSCAHLYYQPKSNKIEVTIQQFDEGGTATMYSYPALDVWVYDYEKVDVSIITFMSALDIEPAHLAKKIPQSLFGKRAMVLGCPFGKVPLVTYGQFGVRNPLLSRDDHIGMSLFVAAGNSGSGAYFFNEETNRWEVVGVVTSYYGPLSPRSGNCSMALRLGVIRRLLRQEGLLYLLGE